MASGRGAGARCFCYAFGTFWFLTVYTGGSGETLLGALGLVCVPLCSA